RNRTLTVLNASMAIQNTAATIQRKRLFRKASSIYFSLFSSAILNVFKKISSRCPKYAVTDIITYYFHFVLCCSGIILVVQVIFSPFSIFYPLPDVILHSVFGNVQKDGKLGVKV